MKKETCNNYEFSFETYTTRSLEETYNIRLKLKDTSIDIETTTNVTISGGEKEGYFIQIHDFKKQKLPSSLTQNILTNINWAVIIKWSLSNLPYIIKQLFQI